MLQYDKLYQSLKKVSGDWHAGHVEWYFIHDYLKFFEDGSFAFAGIEDNDKRDFEKFNFNDPSLTKGEFTQSNRNIVLRLEGLVINAYLNKDSSLIVDGKKGWDIFFPISII